MIPKVLTIAGSDSGGGAGLQADIKTFEEFHTFGISTVTGILTVDPLTHTNNVFPIPEEVIDKQLRTAFSGGSLSSIKTGLLTNHETIDLVVTYLKKYQQTNIVIDPVMAVKNNSTLLQSKLINKLVTKLFPLATIVTPNLIEAQLLSQIDTIDSIDTMKLAAKKIHQLGTKTVVIKGGARLHGMNATDLFYDGLNFELFESPKIKTDTNHGAGCSFSAGITANLARGRTLNKSIQLSKNYVRAGIEKGLYLNDFTGYIWHGSYFNREEE